MERTIRPDTFKASLATNHLIDVRCAVGCDASSEQLPGATWHDPDRIAEWAKTPPRDKPIILCRVRCGSVSNGVVDALQVEGLDACFIEGGIEGWKSAGGEVASK